MPNLKKEFPVLKTIHGDFLIIQQLIEQLDIMKDVSIHPAVLHVNYVYAADGITHH